MANAIDRSVGARVVARWVEVSVLGRCIFRRTFSASDADTRWRPTKCAINRLSRHAKIVAMPLL